MSGGKCPTFENSTRRTNVVSGTSRAVVRVRAWYVTDPAHSAAARYRRYIGSVYSPVTDRHVSCTMIMNSDPSCHLC